MPKTIPIVFIGNADPVGAGLVASLAWPGGNITGRATLAGDLGAKQVELLQAVHIYKAATGNAIDAAFAAMAVEHMEAAMPRPAA